MGERKRRDASVLAGLPRERPQRRSSRRSPAPSSPPSENVPRGREPDDEHGVLGTAVQATGELAAIGAGVVRRALGRLPGR